jgi:hypothetical protein
LLNTLRHKHKALAAIQSMAKRRNLKGLPNSLTQRYFSTLFYFDGGYMADWIWNTAEKSGTTENIIDILNKSIEPRDCKTFDFKPRSNSRCHSLLFNNRSLSQVVMKTNVVCDFFAAG